MSLRFELHLRRALCALERLWSLLVSGKTGRVRREAFGYLLGFFVFVPVGLGASLALGGLCFLLLCEGLAHLTPWLLVGSILVFAIELLDRLKRPR